jgi:hypothetical protein
MHLPIVTLRAPLCGSVNCACGGHSPIGVIRIATDFRKVEIDMTCADCGKRRRKRRAANCRRDFMAMMAYL